MKPIKILIADDHNILRQGLTEIFSTTEDIRVIAEAEDGQSLVTNYNLYKPEVVLTDIEMPVMNGLKAAKKILLMDAEAKILFLSMHSSDELIYKIDSINGKGLLSKTINNDDLIEAVRTVAAGAKYYSGKSEEDINMIKKRFDQILSKDNDPTSLTDRQKSILLLIADGKTSEEIADELCLSKKSIDASRSQIMGKLNFTSLAQLIKYAVEYSHEKNDSFSE